ncbi:MAG: stalk domain-containing protein [Butyricicoccus pullicaecorum]|nr:stalk domain-containing protein [Butyricicoccus pullicaecorum]
MKKKQILAMGLSAVLACSSVAFAADLAAAETTTPATDNTAATETTTTAVPQVKESFRTGSMATVSKINMDGETVSSILVKTTDEQDIQLNLSADTMIVNNETGAAAALSDIKEGDKIYAYYSKAMTRSLPPQSACELILVGVGENTPASLHEVGTVSTNEEGMTEVLTADGSMIIRMDDKTTYAPYKTKNIVTAADLTEGTRFLAWYDIVAMSYPGQAYTQKVVILPAAATEETATETQATRETEQTAAETTELTIVAGGKTLEVKGEMKDGVAVVPVRAAAEALGCTVSYEQKDGKEYVTVENDTRSMTLEIGTDNYVSTTKIEDAVGMTAPAQYGVAPYIVDGTTYAAADLFKALVGFDVVTEAGTVTITAQA